MRSAKQQPAFAFVGVAGALGGHSLQVKCKHGGVSCLTVDDGMAGTDKASDGFLHGLGAHEGIAVVRGEDEHIIARKSCDNIRFLHDIRRKTPVAKGVVVAEQIVAHAFIALNT